MSFDEIRRTLSAGDAAAYVGLSKSYLDKARVVGGGPRYLKLGQRVLYTVPDLDEWLNGHRQQSTSDNKR